MTTVAYCDGVMAADSRTTDGSCLDLSVKKIYRYRHILIGTAGCADTRDILRMLKGVREPEDLPGKDELKILKEEISVIVVFRETERIFLLETIERKGQVMEHEGEFIAIGSGKDNAYGALEMGASAPEAVRIACKYDTGSGLPVRTRSI